MTKYWPNSARARQSRAKVSSSCTNLVGLQWIEGLWYWSCFWQIRIIWGVNSSPGVLWSVPGYTRYCGLRDTVEAILWPEKFSSVLFTFLSCGFTYQCWLEFFLHFHVEHLPSWRIGVQHSMLNPRTLSPWLAGCGGEAQDPWRCHWQLRLHWWCRL